MNAQKPNLTLLHHFSMVSRRRRFLLWSAFNRPSFLPLHRVRHGVSTAAQYCQAPFTRYNLLSNRLSNPFDNGFDNRLYCVNGVSEFETVGWRQSLVQHSSRISTAALLWQQQSGAKRSAVKLTTHYPWPVSTERKHGCQKWHPCSRSVLVRCHSDYIWTWLFLFSFAVNVNEQRIIAF